MTNTETLGAAPNEVSAAHDETEAALRRGAQSERRMAVEAGVTRAVAARMEGASWGACRRAGAFLGLAFYRVSAKRRRLAIANVQMALGVSEAAAQRIARRSAQNWGMTTCEFMHLPGASAREIADYVSLDGLEHLHGALGEGGAIIVTAHLGNWELLAARLAQETTLFAIARPLSNPAAQAHMMRVRTGTGLHIISKHAGARPALKALRDGRALYVLPDRHAGAGGALLPLFGRATLFEASTARFAAICKVPIIAASGVRREPWLGDGRIQGRLEAPFRVPRIKGDREGAALEGTRGIISAVETMVRRNPDQWSWMLRRWRDGDAKCAADAAPEPPGS